MVIVESSYANVPGIEVLDAAQVYGPRSSANWATAAGA